MPLVTDLRPQKNQKRVNVYLDGKFSFGIDLDNLVLSHIKIGAEFSETQIEEIIKKAEFAKTWDKLLRFATTRPRSQQEILDWFRRKEVHESLHSNLLKKLEALNFLNDLEFAKWWINQRIEFKQKPVRALRQELFQKGIDKEIINQILEEAPINEEQMARELLKKKMYKWEKLEPRIRKQKITQYLTGKGFTWDVIERIIN